MTWSEQLEAAALRLQAEHEDELYQREDELMQREGRIEAGDCTLNELRDYVIRAQRLRVPLIIFTMHLWRGTDWIRREALLKPLTCPATLLDRRKSIGAFRAWVFQTRVH